MKSTPAILIIALLGSNCGTAWAEKKPVYQDGVLKDFHTEEKGTHCSTDGDTTGTVTAHTDDYGNTHGTVDANTTASTSCVPRVVAYYTVVVGDHSYVLSPVPKAPSIGKMLIPVAGAMMAFNDAARNSVLYGEMPGTAIKMVNKNGNIYIKVDKRESEFTIVSMKSNAPELSTPSPPSVDTDPAISPNLVTKPFQEPIATTGSPIGEMNAGEKHATEQLRALAEAIKNCPPATYQIPYEPDAMGSTIESGPPENIVWDVYPQANSLRARFLGSVEYLFPLAMKPSLDICSHMKKKKECSDDYWHIFLPDYNRQVAHPQQYRYEFEVTSNGIELLRGLSKAKQVDNEPWAPAAGVESCTRRAISLVIEPDALNSH